MNEDEYVVLLDTYFKRVDKNNFMINLEELSKLIAKYDDLEHRYKMLKIRYNKHSEQYEKRIKHYYTLAHVYKVELGRCRRKLTRIYKVFNDIELQTVTKLIGNCDYKVLVWLLELIHKIKMLLKVV